MSTINQYGRTPQEIAIIIASMNPAIKISDTEYHRYSPEKKNPETKKRLDELEAELERIAISNGEYESRGVYMLETPVTRVK